MKFDWENEKLLLLILIIAYLSIRLPLMTYLPFIQDENIYSMMIEEQIDHPTFIPTFLGYEVGWKPPIFFWIYGIFAILLTKLPIAIEIVYRFPTVFFGLLNIILAYHITKTISGKIQIAFFTSLIYVFIFLVIYTDNLVMTDTLAMTFILGSILAYLKAREDHKFFLLAGLFSFVAFYTKLVNAFVAPIFISAYFFQTNRKLLTHPLFLISLLFIPIAFLSNYFMFGSSEQASAIYLDLIQKKIFESLTLSSFYGSITPFFLLVSLWFPLSLFGLIKNWRENLAMSIWYILIIFPVIAGNYMPFYYLPVMLPMAYFSALLLVNNEKREILIDKFFYIIFALFLLTGSIFGAFIFNEMKEKYNDQKLAGEYLIGKKNVLIIGEYYPAVVAYKVLNEKRTTGNILNYGWILASADQKSLNPLLTDYHAILKDVEQGSFAKMFFEINVYRKDTNITNFDYIVFVGNENLTTNGELLYNDSKIKIFKR